MIFFTSIYAEPLSANYSVLLCYTSVVSTIIAFSQFYSLQRSTIYNPNSDVSFFFFLVPFWYRLYLRLPLFLWHCRGALRMSCFLVWLLELWCVCLFFLWFLFYSLCRFYYWVIYLPCNGWLNYVYFNFTVHKLQFNEFLSIVLVHFCEKRYFYWVKAFSSFYLTSSFSLHTITTAISLTVSPFIELPAFSSILHTSSPVTYRPVNSAMAFDPSFSILVIQSSNGSLH